MSDDDHIKRHLDICQQVFERLVAEGKWAWSDSPKTEDVIESENDPQPLPEETIKALEGLGLVLKSIYLRLHSDGYRLRDGKIINAQSDP